VDTTVTIQQATIDALEALNDPARGITVEAWQMMNWSVTHRELVPMPASENCSHDEAHGKGSCYGHTGDALCLKCMIKVIEDNSVAGSTWSIDVTA
jgi:hypothetical protein